MGWKIPLGETLSVVAGLALGVGTGQLSTQLAESPGASPGIGWPWILAAGAAVLVLCAAAMAVKKLVSQKGRHR